MLSTLGYGLTPRYHTLRKKLLLGNSVVALFGDSLEVHNGQTSNAAGSEEYSNWSRGYYNWCRVLDPRGRWDNWYDTVPSGRNAQGQNQGISGNSTTQMLARISNVTNLTGVKVVIMGGGTNDINQNDPISTIISNFQSMIATFKGLGIKTILLTPPSRPTSGTSSWASGSTQRTAWLSVCSQMQGLADADPNWVKIVRRDLISSNNDTDRTPKTGHLQSDNVHLTPIGGYHIASDPGGLIEKLAQWVAPFTGFPAAVQSGELCINPTLAGTSGTVSTGCTGVAPNSMRFRRTTGANITAVGSKETINGEEFFKIVITRNGAGGVEIISLDHATGNITAGLPSAGSWMRHAMRFRSNASPAIVSINLQAREQPSTPANMNAQSMRTDTGLLWENAALQATDGGGLWQISPPWQWRTGGTSILWNALISVDNSTAGTDTIWISRMHLYPVSDPKPSLGF
jgi:hypothetical protein